MRTTRIKIQDSIITLVFVLAALLLVTGCDDDDPVKEDVPELITQATLTFTPSGGGNVVTTTATDPDGEGVQDIQVDGPIDLEATKSYSLAITLVNGLVQPTEPEYNVTEEVEEEGDEHMFFFSWTNNVFSDPPGNGNIDSRADGINYEDEDVNGMPLGLHTLWSTASISSGNFRVLLKHQPELKSATSDSTTGETDLDITFVINVE